MQRNTLIGLATGVLAGFGFASITAIEGAIAGVVGALNASLIENSMAGIISLSLLIGLSLRGTLSFSQFRPVLFPAGISGALVVLSVAAIAWTVNRVGTTAGTMTLLFGQLILATVIDSFGIGGFPSIPLSIPRIGGLLLMGIGILLVMQR
jgi:transporter family-2 protein